MATAKKTAASRVPQDHKPKTLTTAERLKAEALDDLDNLELFFGETAVPVKHPDEWAATAHEQLAYGSWIGWAMSAVTEEHQDALSEVFSQATAGDLKRQRNRMIAAATLAARESGEGDGSLT